MSVQTAEKACRRLSGGVAPAGVCAAGKGVPPLSTHHSRDSRPIATGRPGKHVVERGGRGPSSGQWGLRTREHCVPAGALGPPVPTNHLSLCHNLPEFSQLCLILGLIYLGFFFIKKNNTSAPGPGGP